MAITSLISTKELKRQASLVFEGKTLEVMLCQVVDEGFDQESTVEDWETVEITADGYLRFSAVVLTGTYNTTTASYEIPAIVASFTGTESYSYNTVVLFFEDEEYPHSIITESPNITLASGQTQSYSIKLVQDD